MQYMYSRYLCISQFAMLIRNRQNSTQAFTLPFCRISISRLLDQLQDSSHITCQPSISNAVQQRVVYSVQRDKLNGRRKGHL